MTPVLIPCSRSAHDQNVLTRRAQGDQHGCHSKGKRTRQLGGSSYIVRCAQWETDRPPRYGKYGVVAEKTAKMQLTPAGLTLQDPLAIFTKSRSLSGITLRDEADEVRQAARPQARKNRGVFAGIHWGFFRVESDADGCRSFAAV